MKRRVWKDVIDLMILSRRNKLLDIVGETYGSLTRLYPFKESHNAEAFERIKFVKEFFYHIGGLETNYAQIN